MAAAFVIPFFTDANVADSVGDFFLNSGHNLTRLRDVMLDNTADPVVAEACRAKGLVLVTHNYRDFRKISRDIQLSRGEMDRLDRIELACTEPLALPRLQQEITMIEAEYVRTRQAGQPMRVYVGESIIRFHR